MSKTTGYITAFHKGASAVSASLLPIQLPVNGLEKAAEDDSSASHVGYWTQALPFWLLPGLLLTLGGHLGSEPADGRPLSLYIYLLRFLCHAGF